MCCYIEKKGFLSSILSEQVRYSYIRTLIIMYIINMISLLQIDRSVKLYYYSLLGMIEKKKEKKNNINREKKPFPSTYILYTYLRMYVHAYIQYM